MEKSTVRDSCHASPESVGRVASGACDTASAAWWGFDAADSTEFLQNAIDSGAPTVVVPYMGKPWVVQPIHLRSDLTLLFDPGVIVSAKKGEFKGKYDSLFVAEDKTDIAMRGYGAQFIMHKEDYQSDAYENAEWRMGIRLLGCSRIALEGMRIEKTGGDGIYVGAGRQPYCKDIVIHDVESVDNHRQGISVIGAENLLIDNCLLSGTDGTPPQAGIDFEPNQAANRLVNCFMRNCVIEENTGAGILFYLSHLSTETPPVSIQVHNCHVRSGRGSGIAFAVVRDSGPEGEVCFENCTIEQTRIEGIHVYAKSAERARVRFINCKCKDVATDQEEPEEGKEPPIPIRLTSGKPEITKRAGGIDFENCTVYDTLDRPTVVLDNKEEGLGIHDLTGMITVYNALGVPIETRCETSEIQLHVQRST